MSTVNAALPTNSELSSTQASGLSLLEQHNSRELYLERLSSYTVQRSLDFHTIFSVSMGPASFFAYALLCCVASRLVAEALVGNLPTSLRPTRMALRTDDRSDGRQSCGFDAPRRLSPLRALSRDAEHSAADRSRQR